jgi:hypothetical protein
MREREALERTSRGAFGVCVCVWFFLGFFLGDFYVAFPTINYRESMKYAAFCSKVIGGGSVRKSGRYTRRIQLQGLASSKQVRRRTDRAVAAAATQ